jgi:hypothetical protein
MKGEPGSAEGRVEQKYDFWLVFLTLYLVVVNRKGDEMAFRDQI